MAGTLPFQTGELRSHKLCTIPPIFFFFNLKIGTSSGSPVVKTPRFQCREHRFNPWLGNKDSACCTVQPKIF